MPLLFLSYLLGDVHPRKVPASTGYANEGQGVGGRQEEEEEEEERGRREDLVNVLLRE